MADTGDNKAMWDEINVLCRERIRNFNPMSEDIEDLWGPPPDDTEEVTS